MTKKRVGFNPLESVIKDTRTPEQQKGKKPRKQAVKKAESQDVKTAGLPEGLRGKKNFYLNKEGEIIQKITLHLPLKLVDQLKREALDKRITVSEIIRERFK